VLLSYHSDMIATAVDLNGLLDEVNDATKALQRSKAVPEQVVALIDRFGSALQPAMPPRGEADPYLTAALWEAAYRAEKALRHDNADERRRGVRLALEQFRHALRDIVENQPYSEGASARDILALTAETVAAPQKTIAELLGVSVRQLQRWLAANGPEPAADDAARIRAVGQVVNQLRHAFTGPGTIAWFYRPHPTLGEPPIHLFADPLHYPQILNAATAARSMTA